MLTCTCASTGISFGGLARETERWTQARVKYVIEREFAVHYHTNYISRLLHNLGWSVQKPDARAVERDEELIRAWLSKDWPRIKKVSAARRSLP